MSKRRFKIDTYDNSRVVTSGKITAADLRAAFKIPDDAEISVSIPTGGDWSGMDATLGTDIPHIDVRWERIK